MSHLPIYKKLLSSHHSLIFRCGDNLVKQPLPSTKLRQISPFLLLQHTGPECLTLGEEKKGIQPHPHRGIEVVTIPLKGTIKHQDSRGFQYTLQEGDMSWLTTGKGIMHSETLVKTTPKEEVFEILHLWINLPHKYKLHAPYTQLISGAQIPYEETNGVCYKLIAGQFNKLKSPIKTYTPIHILLVEFNNQATFRYISPEHLNTGIYMLSGQCYINSHHRSAQAGQLLGFDQSPGEISLHGCKNSRCLIFSGLPIKEPMFRWGPFVMNSRHELQQAQQDYRSGKIGLLSA